MGTNAQKLSESFEYVKSAEFTDAAQKHHQAALEYALNEHEEAALYHHESAVQYHNDAKQYEKGDKVVNF